MSSYEEMVVDRGIDDAWTTFRRRLADWLDDEGWFLGLDPAPHDRHAPILEVRRLDDEIGLFIDWRERLSAAFERPPKIDLVLSALGFDDLGDDMSAWGVPHSHVDEVAWTAATVLADVWGVVHPAFLGLLGEDLPSLYDEADESEAP